MATATDDRLGELRRRIACLEVEAQRNTADARSRMQRYIDSLRRDEHSARASADEQAAAVDERLEQLDNELQLAEHRMAAEYAATEDQFPDALEAALHRWDVYLDRMQAKAAARTGIARERAEAAIADLRQRRISIGKSFSDAGTASDGWPATKTRVLAELDALKSQADAARRFLVGGVRGATHSGAAYPTSGYEGASVTTRATDDLTATGDGVPERSEQEGPKQRVLLVEITNRTIWQVIGGILGTLALLWAATAVRGVLAMIALGFFFSLALNPAVPRLQARFGWGRGTATVVIYLSGIVLIGLLAFVLVPAIDTLADSVSRDGDAWLASLNTWTRDTFGFEITSDTVAAVAPDTRQVLANFSKGPFGTVIGIASRGAALVFSVAAIAVFTFYFTADAPRMQRAVLHLFRPGTQERIGWTWDQAIVQTGGYFYSRLLLMLINGTGFFVTMVIVGTPVSLAAPLAMFGGFVSAFIPGIGAYLGAAIPILVTLAVQGRVAAVAVLAYALIYQLIENGWLAPKISADTMSINGGVAFGAVLLGGAVAGPMGAFVALPVASLITSSISNYGRSYEVVYRSAFDSREPTVADGPAEPDPSAQPARRQTASGRHRARREDPDRFGTGGAQ